VGWQRLSMDEPADVSEEELVEACRQGRRWAQRELFERHHRHVYRALVALCREPGEAEDLTQETFLRAFEALGSFEGRSAIRTWLNRIGVNLFRETRRREQTARRRLARAEAEAPVLRSIPGGAMTRRADPSLRELASRGLAELDESDRVVLVLHVVLGYRYDEIAAILDVAPGTVGSRLSRARRRLREIVLELLGKADAGDFVSWRDLDAGQEER